MTLKILPALTLACLMLPACTTTQTDNNAASTDASASASQTAAATTAAANAAPDIVAADSGIAIGTGWYRYEKYQDQTFRWVDDRAKFLVHPTSGKTKTVSFDLEAGPGIGKPSFVLHVLDKSGASIASTNVVGHERVSFNVPAKSDADVSYTLHADGGGKLTPRENRILNFRVFAIDDKPSSVVATADIVSASDVTLGKNWGVLEQFAGQTFRWVDDDAEIVVNAAAPGSKTVVVDVASGPAVESPANFAIALVDATGKTLQTQHVKAIGSASFTVPLKKGANTFRLHVASTGKATAADKRVLSFRVFKIQIS